MSRPAGGARIFASSRFDIQRQLGAGGMGVVYEAVDLELGTTVALKTLRSVDAGMLRRFKNEFRSLQDIHHPNLVSLGELFEEDGQVFFTMELVPGQGFLDHVRPPDAEAMRASEERTSPAHRAAPPSAPSRSAPSPSVPPPSVSPPSLPPWSVTPGGGFDESRLRAALGQLALGLDALHQAGRVHRDVKPANILVTPLGRVVLLDFGLIAPLGWSERGRGVVGTAHFMAPEQAAGGAVGAAADWYSVGVLLFRALTGQSPFNAASSDAVLRMKQRHDAPAPGRLVPGLPADLEALCVELLRRDPATRPIGAEVLRRLGVAGGLARSDASAPSSPGFVGRRIEPAALAEAFDEVRAGRAAAVLVEGESGMGKSALVRRFLCDVAGAATVLAGRCYQRESVPYKAVDEVVLALAAHLEALPDAAALLPEDVARLAGLFPALETVPAITRAPAPERAAADPQEQRARAFAALRELLGRLAARGPLVVAIDDLQWADAESFALLAELTRAPGAPAMLLVGTVRTGSVTPEARAAIGATLPASGLRVLQLDRLPAGDARALAALLLHDLGGDGSDDEHAPVDARGLVEESGGHPLFIDALVRHRLAVADGGAPVRLDDALWARVQRLEPPARRLLELTAIAGGPVSQVIAAQAAAADLEEISRSTAALRAGNLVRTSGSGLLARLEPYHDRIRETVARRLEPATRRAWHARLALALEASGGEEHEALAIHWAESGDRRRAARYAALAAVRAAEVLAFDRAARLYQRALELETRSGAEVRPLRTELGHALANAGRGREAAEAYLLAVPGAPAAEALDLRRRAAENWLRSGYVDEGTAGLRDVLAAVGEEMPSTPAVALVTLLYRRGRLRLRGLGFTERAERAVDPEALARIDVCWSAALGFGMNDNLRGACFQAQNLRLALDAGEPCRIARAVAMEVPFLSTAGVSARSEVERLLVEAQRLAERTGDPHALGLVPGVRGSALFLQGRFREAVAASDRSDEIFRERCTNVPWERATVRTFAAWGLWFLGDLDALGQRLPAYLREAEERGDRYFATNLRSAFTNSDWILRGHPAEARRLAEESIGGWSREGYHLQHFYDLIARAHLELYAGDGAAAHRYLTERWAALERSLTLRIQLVRVFMEHLRAHAALAAARGLPASRARDLLRQAARSARWIEGERLPWGDPLAAVIRAALARGAGELEAAARHLGAAVRGFEAADLSLFAAAARRHRGTIVGGDAGREAVAAADQWMRDRGVVAPARAAAMLAGGLDAGA